MERAELEQARQKFDSEVRARFAGAAIDKVELLQYGDDPEIEPGDLLNDAHPSQTSRSVDFCVASGLVQSSS